MWCIHHSNRMECLASELASLLREQPAGPFTPEVLLVPNPGLGRWLQITLAEELGATANLSLESPAGYLRELVADMVGEEGDPVADPLSRESLTWSIFTSLPGLISRPEFADIAKYLSGDSGGSARFALADQLADVYDQYLFHRPDWIRAWGRGEEPEDWQAALWREIGRGKAHRVDQLDLFARTLDAGTPDLSRLPRRVTLFGASSLPQVTVQAYQALAQYIDVHVFFLNPSRFYWADIVSEKNRSRRLARMPFEEGTGAAEILETRHPLLASLGRQGQDYFRLIYESTELEETADFVAPIAEPQDTVLGDLQRSILELDGEVVANLEPDTSLQVSSCYSAQRECQVLQDDLLRLFEENGELSPRDVVVMVPDIDLYAPCIDAVFDDPAAPVRIPYTISDRRGGETHPLITLVGDLLALGESRLPRSEVLRLLEVPALRRRLDLDESGVADVRALVEEGGARWAMDGRHRAACDIPDHEQNTWSWAEERILLGFAIAPEPPELYEGIAPIEGVEGDRAVAAGALAALLDLVRVARADLKRPRTVPAWESYLHRLLNDFLAPDLEEEDILSVVRSAAAELSDRAARAGCAEEITVEVYASALEAELGTARPTRGYLTGAVTFCSFQPMRSIPFRVVCLLGMNETDFPRTQLPRDFDRLPDERRIGDRCHRDADRYAFLEAVLSARDHLLLSYIGRSSRDDTERQPSVVVAELLDWLDARHPAQEPATQCAADPSLASGSSEPATFRGRLVRQHPLQPFSASQFRTDSPLWSYNDRWAEVCQALSAARTDPDPWIFQPPLPDTFEGEGTQRVALADLLSFFRDPPAAFLRSRWGIYLREEEEPPDAEPFCLSGLTEYQIRDRALDILQQGAAPDAVEAWLLAEGWFPPGGVAAAMVREQRRQVQSLLRRLEPYAAPDVEDLYMQHPVEVDGHSIVVEGWLDNLRDGQGRVAFRPGKLNLGNRLEAWIMALSIAALNQADSLPRSVFLARDTHSAFDVASLAGPKLAGRWADLLRIYLYGLRQPVPLFRRAADEVYKVGKDKGWDEEVLRPAVRKDWKASGGGFGGESERPPASVVARGCEDPWKREAIDLYTPILEDIANAEVCGHG